MESRKDEQLRTDRLEIYQADLDRIERCLKEFIKLSGAHAAILVDRDGHLVTQEGKLDKIPLDTVAALVAGSFAATHQMAKLLGESEFSSLYHQGNKDHLLIQLVGNRALLTILFNETTTLGMVRLYATEAAKRLEAVFQDSESQRQQLDTPSAPFGNSEEAKSEVEGFFDR